MPLLSVPICCCASHPEDILPSVTLRKSACRAAILLPARVPLRKRLHHHRCIIHRDFPHNLHRRNNKEACLRMTRHPTLLLLFNQSHWYPYRPRITRPLLSPIHNRAILLLNTHPALRVLHHHQAIRRLPLQRR